MKIPPFESYKVNRLIQWYGAKYTFYRDALDKFKDRAGYAGEVGTLKGIFHEGNEFITLTTTDGSNTQSKQSPRIFCRFDDAKYLQPKDFVNINGKKYEVNGVYNFNEFNYAADISLRLIEHG